VAERLGNIENPFKLVSNCHGEEAIIETGFSGKRSLEARRSSL
jgi:hypothetical protein